MYSESTNCLTCRIIFGGEVPVGLPGRRVLGEPCVEEEAIVESDMRI